MTSKWSDGIKKRENKQTILGKNPLKQHLLAWSTEENMADWQH